jgi:hypothetical protein
LSGERISGILCAPCWEWVAGAELLDDDAHPYADPIYWSAFQISGW